MKVQSNNIIDRTYSSDAQEVQKLKLAKTALNGTDKTSVSTKSSQQNFGYNRIITKSEREFFIKLFPDNIEQLSKHVLFNRNGKLTPNNTQKGVIFDGVA